MNSDRDARTMGRLVLLGGVLSVGVAVMGFAVSLLNGTMLGFDVFTTVGLSGVVILAWLYVTDVICADAPGMMDDVLPILERLTGRWAL